MRKCKVCLLGRVFTDDDIRHMRKIERVLNEKRPDLDAYCIRQDAMSLYRKCKMTYAENLFNLTIDAIESTDMVLIIEPTVQDSSGIGYVKWVLGYSWAVGVPVGILTDFSQDKVAFSPIPVISMHAHFTSIDEVLAYCFCEKPFIPYKGIIS